LRERLGKIASRAIGVLLLAFGILQAWPGRGYWQGNLGHGGLGSLASMAQQMSQTPQPSVVGSIVSWFAGAVSDHGFAANLVAVVLLIVLGAAFLSADGRILRVAAPAAVVFFALDWVFVQDMGVFGGTGTDPNSMVPAALVALAAYIALTRAAVLAEPAVLNPSLELPADVDDEVAAVVPAAVLAAAAAATDAPPEAPARTPAWRGLAVARPGYLLRILAAASAIVLIVLGAAPMALASLSHSADTTLALAIDGPPTQLDANAPGFSLVNQNGHLVTLEGLEPKLVVLTFLDPVCTTDCPVIAQEMRLADQLLGQSARSVEFVAVATNPLYHSLSDLAAFDAAEKLSGLSNWLFLTGTTRQLSRVWSNYGVQVIITKAGGMVGHSDWAYVIGPSGTERWALNADPGPGTGPSEASFAGLVQQLVLQTLAKH
jgi:cytochrome oxidase Cu insertion factor (SCO1/SenC/PrrC family)